MTLPTERWRTLMDRVAAEHPPLPTDVFEAMIFVESGGDPNAKSASNAIGLTQIIAKWHEALIDRVALALGKTGGEQALYEPEINLRVGASHLVWCYTSDGSKSWERAIRKYFTGSADPPPGFEDGQGTTPDQHIAKLRKALEQVRVDRGVEQETPVTDRDVTRLNFDQALVPLPKHSYQDCSRKKPGIGMDYLGDRTFRGIVFHRALSGQQTFQNAIDWLLNPISRGLTDGFIDHRTGSMVFINPMKQLHPASVLPAGYRDRAGWAQGPYTAAEASADGQAFRNNYGGEIGAHIINQDLESMEITGNYEFEISEGCKQTLAQWAASRAQLLKIPWWSFPINPATGLTIIFGHREFCGLSHKVCPGAVVWAFINGELIDMAQAILKAAQTTGKPIDEPIPVTIYVDREIPAFIAAMEDEPSYRETRADGSEIVYFPTEAQYVAFESAPQFKWADDGSPKVGPDTPAGEDANFAFVFDWNGEGWGLRPDGTRQRLKHFKVVSEGGLRAA